MKNYVAVGLFVACVSAAVICRAQASPDNVNDEILKLEQAWLDAAAAPDLPALRKLISEDFMGTAFGPSVLSKDDIVPRDGTRANHLPKLSLLNPTVRVFSDTAVLMGDLQPEDATMGGFRVTTVFQKQGQGWQIIAIHMSPAQTRK